MNVRIVLATAATCLLGCLVVVPAASPAAVHHTRRPSTQLTFNFDNGESLRRGTFVRNVTGRGRGKVVTAAHGRLKPVRGHPGRAALFPRVRQGRAIIEVRDRRSLDPRRRVFTFGASVRMSHRQGRHHANLIQKGYFRQRGGQYKLQSDFGRISCVVFGSAGRVIARAPRSIANRRWHRVTCRRRPHAVILRIDGRLRARVRRATGGLANAAPVRVGGKNVKNAHNDQFHGSLDNVFVRIRRR